MALPASATEATSRPFDEDHLRRCWYRRLIRVTAGRETVYAVECLYPNRTASIPLGDLETARPVCNTCQAGGVFRPDEE
jgi:hypothetical protein